MTTLARKREAGSALLMVLLLMMLMGLIGFAALETVTRDQRVAAYHNRKKIAFYAADAAVAEIQHSLRTGDIPVLNSASLGAAANHPAGVPSYSLDPTATDPIEDLGTAPMPGMNLALGQNGAPKYQMRYWRTQIEGQAPGGTISRIEFTSSRVSAN